MAGPLLTRKGDVPPESTSPSSKATSIASSSPKDSLANIASLSHGPDTSHTMKSETSELHQKSMHSFDHAQEASPSVEDPESPDSDLGSYDGDTVISRGYPRNWENLVANGLRPIWTGAEGYPEKDIPLDILEFLDENGTRPSAKMIGPLSSIAWLAGLDGLVEAISSPAYTIEDSIEVVPLGAGIMWPVEPHIEQGMIASHIATRVVGYPVSCPKAVGRDQAPNGITENPTPFDLKDITQASRLERPSGKILSMKITTDKNVGRLEREIRRQSDGCLDSGKLWFRALSLAALRSTLSFFIPEASGSNRDNEFGSGFYTTDTMQVSLEYLRGGVGAIMVFKDPDLSRARVWQPGLKDWAAWVARWTELPLEAPIESQYADFIKGPISASQVKERRGTLPQQSEADQLVGTSYQGCQILSDSLYLIIFVESR